MSATNRPFALIRPVRSESGIASRSLCTMERSEPDGAVPACGVSRTRTARDLLLDQQARLDGPAGLEGRVVALPDHAIPSLGPKIDAIELLDDVLHLVGMNRGICGVIRR